MPVCSTARVFLLLFLLAAPLQAAGEEAGSGEGEATEGSPGETVPETVPERVPERRPEIGEETGAAPAGPWQRLSRHGAWKVAGFTFSFSVISFASDYDRESSDWAREQQPLGELSLLGDHSPPFMLGGTAATLGAFALWAPEDRRRDHRLALESFAVSQLINAGLTDLLKVAVGRPRPDSGHRSSFPSGHTSSAAAWATLLWRRYGWKAGVPATLFAILVGASRIQDGRHYLSDVLAGAALGVSVTYVVDELLGP